jgi:integrase
MSNVNVYIRGNSIWCNFSIQGILYRKPFKIKNNKNNYRLALNRASELEEMLDNNIIPSDDDIIIKSVLKKPVNSEKDIVFTLDNYIKTFIESGHFSDRNKGMYNAAYKKFQEVIDTTIIQVSDVNSIHYGTFKEYLLEKLTYNSARTYIGYMSIIFSKAINAGIYKGKNPFIRLKRKDKLFIRILTDKHLDLILEHLKKDNINLYRLVYFISKTGFRLNEAVELTWEQIKWKEKMIDLYNFKDNRYDLFPMNLENGTLIEFLSAFQKDSGKVFNVNYYWVTKPYQKAIKAINEEMKVNNKKWKDIPNYTIHDLRRTFGSKYAKRLMPLELMKLMRHKDVETTLRYYVNMEMNDIVDKLNKV